MDGETSLYIPPDVTILEQQTTDNRPLDFSPVFIKDQKTLRTILPYTPITSNNITRNHFFVHQVIEVLEEFPIALVPFAIAKKYLPKILKRARMTNNIDTIVAVTWILAVEVADAAPPLVEFVNTIKKKYKVSYHNVLSVVTRIGVKVSRREKLIKYVRWYASKYATDWRDIAVAVLVAEKVRLNGSEAMLAKLIVQSLFRNAQTSGRSFSKLAINKFLTEYKDVIEKAREYVYGTSHSAKLSL